MIGDALVPMPWRVGYFECGMRGRVFNGRQLSVVDMARTEARRGLVGGYQVGSVRGIELVVGFCDARAAAAGSP